MKYKPLLATLLIVASVIVTTITPFTAGAVSAYDSEYQTTDNLFITTRSNPVIGSCTGVDVAGTWQDYITDTSKWRPGDDWSADKARFLQAVDSGDYVVSNYATLASGGYYHSYVVVYYTLDQSLQFNWSSGGVTVGSASNVGEIKIGAEATSAGNCVPGISTASYSSTSGYVSMSETIDYEPTVTGYTWYANFITKRVDTNLPVGYEGPSIKTDYLNLDDFWFNFTLLVDDRSVSIIPNPPMNPPGCFEYGGIIYTSPDDNVADNGTVVMSNTDNKRDDTTPFNLPPMRLLDYRDDYYMLVVTEDCNAPLLSYGKEHKAQLMKFKVDGSTYSLNSADAECATNFGFCQDPNALEDCTTYGTDLVGGFQCIMSNFLKLMRALFVSLFVPKPYAFYAIFDDASDFFTEKFGFLSYPFVFLNNFFTAIVGGDDNCEQYFEGNFFGAPGIPLNICQVVHPSIETFIRLSVSSLTVVGLFLAFRRKYMGIIAK